MGRSFRTGKPTVLVVGAGVSGLTCALILRSRGFGVTVVAKDFAPRITSVVAGALWEWPPAVCGYHRDQASLSRSRSWCMASYGRFEELAARPATGVFLRTATFYSRRPFRQDPLGLAKMEELRDKVREFVHDPGLIEANGVSPAFGLRDAYSHLSPMIDTDAYLPWLLNEVSRAGCQVTRQCLSGNLRGRERELLGHFHADAIVNCSGLGARELAGDPMFPLRGALIRVRNDGRSMPRITQAHCLPFDESTDQREMVFIVPRGEDWLVLGGLVEPHEWGLDIGIDTHAPIRRMLDCCLAFLPALRDAEIDAVEPVRVGLRPYRERNVRLEHEPGTRIVHNYGHGGSGVTLSWGCAEEVANAVERLVDGDQVETSTSPASALASPG